MLQPFWFFVECVCVELVFSMAMVPANPGPAVVPANVGVLPDLDHNTWRSCRVSAARD